ncbi:MAG: rod shape-determining protein MreC [Pyrinomonadaceae bacterium]
MVALSQKEIRRRTPLMLAGLLLGNFAMMAWNAKDPETQNWLVRVWLQAIAAPVQNTVTTAGNTGTGFFSNLAAWRTAVSENDSLKQRVGELETELAQKQNLTEENENLKSQLDLKNQSQYKTVAAQVIGRDPSAWFDAVVINRGSNAGIEINMPVVTANGVVGRIVAVSPFTAQVSLVTDDKSAVGGVVGETGNSGATSPVVGTSNKDLLEMRYVSGQETIVVGTPILTTGQDKIYPAGLKIGEVAEVKVGSATTPHTILVKPSVPSGSLKEVTVLLYKPQAQPTFDKTLPNVKPQNDKNSRRNR